MLVILSLFLPTPTLMRHKKVAAHPDSGGMSERRCEVFLLYLEVN